MRQYLEALDTVIQHGEDREDRTGTGTRAIFGYQIRLDLTAGFPLLTTKEVHFKSVILELIWMLKGFTNVKWLQQQGVTIWDEWANNKGDLGPIYGHQWRSWQGADQTVHDQIEKLIAGIQTDPFSRRHIVNAWNVGQLDEMALPPCHVMFQFMVSSEGYLLCHMYQRSADIFLGVPFNIASYAALVHVVAAYTGFKPGGLFISYGDLHLYSNHFDQASEQLSREPKKLPTLSVNPYVPDHFQNLKLTDFKLSGYNPAPKIEAPISI